MTCKWIAEDDESGTYETSCKQTFFTLDCDKVSDYDFKYCCYCGKILEAIEIEDQEEK